VSRPWKTASKKAAASFNDRVKEAASTMAANIEGNLDSTALGAAADGGGGGGEGGASGARASSSSAGSGHSNGGGPGPGPRGAQDGKAPTVEYVKLPVASARKLRFYDAADLSEVIAGHLEEKQALAEENARLGLELEAGAYTRLR